jgi:hypothetical protein
MDFMTADTLFGKRLYLLIILELQSRKIVKCDITEYAHDNAAQFTTIDFKQYDIHSVNTSIAAPNMNAYTE